MNTDNQENKTESLGQQYQINLHHKDIELIFKYLGRADLKGAEVPEMNKIISLFEPSKLKRI
jgi:hypothetical protein